jgi:hypothetical protein
VMFSSKCRQQPLVATVHQWNQRCWKGHRLYQSECLHRPSQTRGN